MHIDAYSFGQITIAARAYTSDVLLYPDRVQASWWRREGHRLDVADLKEVLDAQPATLIVGTGYHGRMEVPPETRAALREKGIRLHVAPTPEAVEIFNAMREASAVCAALHLTC
ncbi:MAG: Mth938-like domain-containing protein [Planctomycetota bacterium]|jgi:hypothetical protein